ncbi:hypothetical protein CBS101457_001165 [Exobasidium rhododendri]|nr:hypothetical protein CBS101457_001165 [Exobasidium rhododendri]
MELYRSTLRKLVQDQSTGLSEGETVRGKEGEGVKSNKWEAAHSKARPDKPSLDLTASQSGIGEQIEKIQVGRVLDDVDVDQLPLLEATLFHESQTTEMALRVHGAPATCLVDLLSALPSRYLCGLLVSHFYDDVNWIRQPWPRSSLCQSFSAFWSTGPVLTGQNLNTFALLCSLCAIARLTIQHVDFDSSADERKLDARRLHYTSRHALMLSSIFNQESLDQIIAWTLACRFLVLEKRYGEAYTCAARTVKAAYSIELHRDGLLQGKSREVTEARRRVWSAVYYFDRTISIFTGRPPVIDDRYCDVCAPSEEGDWSDIYTLPDTRNLRLSTDARGKTTPTPFAYCVQRQKISILQGQMIATLLRVQGKSSMGKEVASIDQELHAIKASFPSYLRVELTHSNTLQFDDSFDEVYGFLPIQRFLLQSEVNALCIDLHRPFLLNASSKDAKSLDVCVNAALLDIALHKDFSSSRGSISQLVFEVYVGTHRMFHAILLCGIVLLAHPQYEKSEDLLQRLQEFIDKDKTPTRSADLPSSSMRMREIQIVKIFVREHYGRQSTGKRKAGSDTSATSGCDGRGGKRTRIEDSYTANMDRTNGEIEHSPAKTRSTSVAEFEWNGQNEAQELLDSLYAKANDDFIPFFNQQAGVSSDDASHVFGSALYLPTEKSADGTGQIADCDSLTLQDDVRWGNKGQDIECAPAEHSDLSRQVNTLSSDFFDGDFWHTLINKL